MKYTALIWILFALSLASSSKAEEVRIPAFTAYIQPSPRGARVSEEQGVTRWKDPSQTVNWFGKFAQEGDLTAKVELKLSAGDSTKFKLSIDGQSHEATVTANDEQTVVADFGTFKLSTVGYHSITLTALAEPGMPLADVQTLVLDGTATKDVHFNRKERRNAASVHLSYVVPKDIEVEAFTCDVTAVDDPTHTFYMACGWHRGYFGMQVNSPTERRIIFSVWDSGNEAVSRDKVSDIDRVKLMGKGEGVYTGDFGNEGTGGHSHLKVQWKTGVKQRFIVTAQPVDKTFTIYSGYWFHTDQNKWMLISSWRAPKEGGWLRGLHSFSENFVGENGQLRRKALFGNQWYRTAQGDWQEILQAKFSHDPTGKADRLDRFMGVETGQFFLSHGGFVDGYNKFGDPFTRPTAGQAPVDIVLPVVPGVPKSSFAP